MHGTLWAGLPIASGHALESLAHAERDFARLRGHAPGSVGPDLHSLVAGEDSRKKHPGAGEVAGDGFQRNASGEPREPP